MKRDPRLYLHDIVESIEKIESYVSGLTCEELAKKPMALDAVLRNFGIIGEASVHVPDELKEQCPSVPWKRVRGMRNVVVHEYFGVDVSIIWETIHESLPVLKREVQRLLDQLEEP